MAPLHHDFMAGSGDGFMLGSIPFLILVYILILLLTRRPRNKFHGQSISLDVVRQLGFIVDAEFDPISDNVDTASIIDESITGIGTELSKLSIEKEGSSNRPEHSKLARYERSYREKLLQHAQSLSSGDKKLLASNFKQNTPHLPEEHNNAVTVFQTSPEENSSQDPEDTVDYMCDDDYYPQSPGLEPVYPRLTPSPPPIVNPIDAPPKDLYALPENPADHLPADWLAERQDEKNDRLLRSIMRAEYRREKLNRVQGPSATTLSWRERRAHLARYRRDWLDHATYKGIVSSWKDCKDTGLRPPVRRDRRFVNPREDERRTDQSICDHNYGEVIPKEIVSTRVTWPDVVSRVHALVNAPSISESETNDGALPSSNPNASDHSTQGNVMYDDSFLPEVSQSLLLDNDNPDPSNGPTNSRNYDNDLSGLGRWTNIHETSRWVDTIVTHAEHRRLNHTSLPFLNTLFPIDNESHTHTRDLLPNNTQPSNNDIVIPTTGFTYNRGRNNGLYFAEDLLPTSLTWTYEHSPTAWPKSEQDEEDILELISMVKIEREKLEKLLRLCDVALLSSTRRYDNSLDDDSTKILEEGLHNLAEQSNTPATSPTTSPESFSDSRHGMVAAWLEGDNLFGRLQSHTDAIHPWEHEDLTVVSLSTATDLQAMQIRSTASPPLPPREAYPQTDVPFLEEPCYTSSAEMQAGISSSSSTRRRRSSSVTGESSLDNTHPSKRPRRSLSVSPTSISETTSSPASYLGEAAVIRAPTMPPTHPTEDGRDPSLLFKCTFCALTFSTIGQLNDHVWRKHARRFQCTICSKKFNLKADLERHKRSVHSYDDKPTYVCTNKPCFAPGKVFDRKDNFQRHLKRCVGRPQKTRRARRSGK